MPARFYWRDPDAPSTNRPRGLGALAVITDAEDRILLERRTDSGQWGFVAGAADPGESAVDALLRETREETGVEIASCELLGVFTDPTRICSYPDGNVTSPITVAFMVALASGTLQPSAESHELRWWAYDDIAGLDLAATFLPILLAVGRRLSDPAYVHVD